MRRGAKPAKAKVEAKLPVAGKSLQNERSRVRDLEKRLAEVVEREAEALKRESEALEQQTATAEILRVISSSPTDVQPVFDAIVRTGARLCEADYGFLARYDGTSMAIVAHSGATDEEIEAVLRVYPMAPTPDSLGGRTILERAVVHIPDVRSDPTYGPRVIQDAGWRTGLGVPLLREGAAIGLVGMWRRDVRPFSDRQIALLQTFADQAVIAIENARLFRDLVARNAELGEALEQQTATSEILRVISSSPTALPAVCDVILERITRLCEADIAAIFVYDGEFLSTAASRGTTPRFAEHLRHSRPRPSRETTTRLAALERRPVHAADLLDDPQFAPRPRDLYENENVRTVLSVPMLREGHLIGVLTTWRREVRPFADKQVTLLQTFADQAVIAVENGRLFREIAEKSQQLEVASQHKSEFLANMSHELRTPLNAILGFSEVLAEGMFGEVNEKQTEYLRDILESGRHLLSLINDILDLSKIEAGRMDLETTDFDLPAAIDNALTLVRERAGRRGIALRRAIDEGVGIIHADERKVKQVLLNLLSNALKFTPESGRVDVRLTLKEGLVEVSVADTGVGIAPEDQEAVFEEFRQVGTADKKVEGTGLGLALSRKFVELHGGRIWVKSQVGEGSTFTFTLPVRREV